MRLRRREGRRRRSRARETKKADRVSGEANASRPYTHARIVSARSSGNFSAGAGDDEQHLDAEISTEPLPWRMGGRNLDETHLDEAPAAGQPSRRSGQHGRPAHRRGPQDREPMTGNLDEAAAMNASASPTPRRPAPRRPSTPTTSTSTKPPSSTVRTSTCAHSPASGFWGKFPRMRHFEAFRCIDTHT
jgi:hypothetical protein